MRLNDIMVEFLRLSHDGARDEVALEMTHRTIMKD